MTEETFKKASDLNSRIASLKWLLLHVEDTINIVITDDIKYMPDNSKLVCPIVEKHQAALYNEVKGLLEKEIENVKLEFESL